MNEGKRLIALDARLPDRQRAELRKLLPDWRIVDGLEPENLREAEVVHLGVGKFDPADAPKLKWIQFNSAGIGALVGSAIARSPIPVATASGAYSTAVAELALAHILALVRRLPFSMANQAKRFWPEAYEDYRPYRGDNLRGKTAGIIGYGSIGREVARLLRAFGVRILACKRDPSRHGENRYRAPGTGDPEGKLPEKWYGFEEAETMIRQVDLLILTLPATPGTEGMVRARHIDSLPRHALFINVGRGNVVEEAALVAALREGRIAGAGLDVVAEEPLPKSSPLWSLPNVLLTPHIASYTGDQEAQVGEVLLENVRRHLAGEPLVNLVDFKQGY